MDTSEEYIKMCERAEEIQKIRPHFWGDFRYNIVLKKIEVINDDSSMDDQEIYIWLPRQDQLQEMITADLFGWKNIDNQDKLDFFEDCLSRDDNLSLRSISFEQAWLAFVMKEKYGKIWNGEDWVREE